MAINRKSTEKPKSRQAGDWVKVAGSRIGEVDFIGQLLTEAADPFLPGFWFIAHYETMEAVLCCPHLFEPVDQPDLSQYAA